VIDLAHPDVDPVARQRLLDAVRAGDDDAQDKWVRIIEVNLAGAGVLNGCTRGDILVAAAEYVQASADADRKAALPLTDSENLRLKPLAEFLSERLTVEFVVDDLLQRGWLYALTGATGAGKTGVAVPLALCVGSGRRFGKHESQRGPVVYIAGENPSDVRARFAVAAPAMSIAPEASNLHVLDASFILADRGEELRQLVDSVGAALVIVDTDQAVSLGAGAEENDNAERMLHAKRLRELTRCNSRPTVLDLCHPRKNAGRDELTPRGGSAFLNEIDGNLGLWREGDSAELFSDPNKYRGAPVSILFQKSLVHSDVVRDTKGRQIPVPFYRAVSDDEAAAARKQDWSDENRLLWAMGGEPQATQLDWARTCQWLSEDGQPRKDKVNRLLRRLEQSKLVKQARSGRWTLTDAGKKEASRP